MGMFGSSWGEYCSNCSDYEQFIQDVTKLIETEHGENVRLCQSFEALKKKYKVQNVRYDNY